MNGPYPMPTGQYNYIGGLSVVSKSEDVDDLCGRLMKMNSTRGGLSRSEEFRRMVPEGMIPIIEEIDDNIHFHRVAEGDDKISISPFNRLINRYGADNKLVTAILKHYKMCCPEYFIYCVVEEAAKEHSIDLGRRCDVEALRSAFCWFK